MQRLTLLDDQDLTFPDINLALSEPDGLLAVGADLSPERLIQAYRHGIFPWYEDDQPILWWSPDPRCVVDPASYKPSRSLARRLARHEFDVRVDENFQAVIEACRFRGAGEGTWITQDMADAYLMLHRLGIAHSIESYAEGELVGGLYGLSIGSLFFGESMFHHRTDASKVAFASLAKMMAKVGCPLIDCQISNPHLMSLGAFEIPREDFKAVLASHIDDPALDWPFLREQCQLITDEKS